MSTNQEYINASQVYQQYGIPRAVLGSLVQDGKITVKKIVNGSVYLNLYKVADLERVINGDSDHD